MVLRARYYHYYYDLRPITSSTRTARVDRLKKKSDEGVCTTPPAHSYHPHRPTTGEQAAGGGGRVVARRRPRPERATITTVAILLFESIKATFYSRRSSRLAVVIGFKNNVGGRLLDVCKYPLT